MARSRGGWCQEEGCYVRLQLLDDLQRRTPDAAPVLGSFALDRKKAFGGPRTEGIVAELRRVISKAWFKAAMLLSLFVLAYWVPFQSVVNTWLHDEDYSYGFFIPFVSAYIVWQKRHELRACELASSWRVLPFLLAFVLLSLYGILGSSGNISMPSLPVLMMLLTAFVFGVGTAKCLILPFGFLFFMVPIPAILERTLGLFLKSVSTSVGGAIISLAGIPVHISGNIIDLGTSQLQVVDACSGLRYLFPLFALGIVYAYFFQRTTWKRIFCVIATLPIAVATNALRIGITGIIAERYDSSVAEGFFHGFSGWALFMVAFAFLFVMGRLLRLFPPKSGSIARRDREQAGVAFEPVKGRGVARGALLVTLFLLAVVGTLSFSTKALPAIRIRGTITSFPLQFSGWQGRAEAVDPQEVVQSGAEEAFDASYTNTTREKVSLYIGYRSTAFLANENFFHSPTVCLPSSGWKTVSTSTRTISDVSFFGMLPVSEMVVENADNKLLVYFWFQTKDQVTHDKNINRFHLALHAIRRDNTHDLFMRPLTPIGPHETVEEARKRLDAFVRDMTPILLTFLKENQFEAR